jgi:hypothetical protein
MIAMRCLCVFTALLLTWASSLAKGGGLASLAAKASVPRLVVLVALAGLTVTAPTLAQARGGQLHLNGPFSPQSQPGSRAGMPTPSISPKDFLAGCGRGRHRDPATQRCLGPADVH